MERREHTRQLDRVKARGTVISSVWDVMNAIRWATLVFALTAPGCAGSTGTIGAVLGQRADGRLFVREVPPHLAAAREGIRAGDEIILIDGRDVRSMNTREVHRVLEGDVGDTVKLTLVRGNEVVRATLRLTPAVRTAETRQNPQ